MRRTQRISTQISYTFSDAQGTGSFPNSSLGAVNTQDPIPKVVSSLTANSIAIFPNSNGQTLAASSFLITDVVKRDGGVPFTGAQSGVDPTTDAHLSTRAWIAARGGWANTGASAVPNVGGRQSSLTSTSNAAITDFSNGVAGQFLTFFVDAATKQFVHDVTKIRMRDKMTAQLRQYDTITFGFNGSVWWEVSRTEAKFITGLGGSATPSVLGVQIASISGTTTITNFSNPYTGQIVYILATSSFKVTHQSGSIELAGSVDFDMVSDDTLTIMYDGSGWHEMARKVD